MSECKECGRNYKEEWGSYKDFCTPVCYVDNSVRSKHRLEKENEALKQKVRELEDVEREYKAFVMSMRLGQVHREFIRFYKETRLEGGR